MVRLLLTSLKIFLLVFFLRVIVQRFVPLPRYDGPELLPEASRPAELLPEADFWRLIEASRHHGLTSYNGQLSTLSEELAGLDTLTLRRFDRTLAHLLRQSYDARLWQAAYAVNGGCSDDCFEYFRGWLMTQGRDKFYWTLRHPRLLLLTGRSEFAQGYEGLEHVAAAQYWRKAGRRMPAAESAPYQLKGPMFDERAALLRYPELWLLVW
ncbi:DUF4240 domain-containing protein [Hymenobacter gummosus]|uniref:DUF4240 domain-containing protein n=1 Tax=Hymenobacter gummosus TaxID=1776032 RepID=UPI001A9E4446|nr:DUF4240 domain-containing protein [Hymenobacter gummosus]